MKKVLVLFLVAALSVTTVFGCGKSNSANASASTAAQEVVKATVKVWGPAEDQSTEQGKWLQTMCEKFNADHPEWDITYEYSVCSEGDAAKTIAQDPSNSGDVYFFANDQIQTLIDANAISKLGGETADYVKSTNSGAIVDSVSIDGNIYGVPFTTNTWFMYYDKSKFTEADVKNLDTMLAKKKVAFPLSNSWYMASFYLANGCPMFDGGKNNAAGINFAGDKGVAVTKYLVNLTKNSNFVNDADGVGIAGLRDGSIGAIFSGSWDYKSVKEILGDNFAAKELPTVTIDAKQQQLKSFAGSKAIGVNPNCKNPQIAVALAKYLGGKDAQSSHYELRSVIPCNTELLNTSEIKADVLVTAQNNTFEKTSIMQPFVSGMNNFWTPAENFGKSIVNGEVTLDNAADKTTAFNNAINTAGVN